MSPEDPECIYPFGIDPVWGRSRNNLQYVNSLKMKISVIIAIIHMTVGVIIKAFNARYFKKKLDFYYEFIPQFIFLTILFGYMDFLIVFKWLTDWTGRINYAPSIISTMMNIGLKLGKTVYFFIYFRPHNLMEEATCGDKGEIHLKTLSNW